MKSAFAFVAGVSLLLVSGCGGGGDDAGQGRGEVSGVVFDQSGVPVRGARVFYDGSGGADRETVTTTSGTYTLTDVPGADIVIRAEIRKDNVRYYGQNLASVAGGERAKSVNIAVYPDSQLATLRGEVRDREGFLLRGVRVFLRPTGNSAILSSAVGITGDDGRFAVGGLLGGQTYRVQVNGLGFNSDFETITLNAQEERFVNFTVPDGVETNVPAPSNLAGVVYTSPPIVRSDARLNDGIEAIKQRLRPRRTHSLIRSTVRGNPIEADLFWDEIDNTALLGFGIYRGQGNQALRNVGFLRDPRAVFFADNDEALVENVNYTYAVTSLDTLYDGEFGESDPSNTVTLTPLGDLLLGAVTSSTTPTFRWTAVPGATRYSVFLYTSYPSIGETEIFTNYANPVSGTEYTYNGTPLTSGRTYYYVVVAERADQTAVSLSTIGQFTVP